MRRALSILLLLLCLPARASLPTLGALRVERVPAATTPARGLVQWDARAPVHRAVNLVFASEAYAADRLHAFPLDAQRAWRVLESLAPFNRHLGSINRWLLILESRENGADKPGGIQRDTLFGAYYGDRGVRRLIGCDPDAHWRLLEEIGDAFPRGTLVLLVNDAEYGGSGGLPLLASTHADSGWIFVHEFLHAFAGLGDEYPVAKGALPFAYPNVALSTNAVPWAGFPGAGLVKIEAGRWKPFPSCLMHSLATPRLCAWCEHVVEQKILSLIQP